MSLSLHTRAVEIEQILLHGCVDDQHRKQLEQAHGGHHPVVDELEVAGKRLEQDRDGPILAAQQEGLGDDVRSPPSEEGKDAQCGQARPDNGHHHAPPNLEARTSIDQRGHFQGPRDVVKEAFHQPDPHGQGESGLHQRHAQHVVVQSQTPKHVVDAHEQRDAGKGVQEQRRRQDDPAPRETEPRKGVTGHRGDDHIRDSQRHGHHQRVADHPVDGGIVGQTLPQETPVLQREATGRDQTFRPNGDRGEEQPEVAHNDREGQNSEQNERYGVAQSLLETAVSFHFHVYSSSTLGSASISLNLNTRR